MKLSKNTTSFVTCFTLLMILLLKLQGRETRPAANQATGQSKPKPTPAKQDAAKKDPPTLGFNHIKDVSPIADEDAFMEELRMKKELPDNPLIYEKRAMHEAALMNEFMEGFKDSKECNGITFYLKTDKKPYWHSHRDHCASICWYTSTAIQGVVRLTKCKIRGPVSGKIGMRSSAPGSTRYTLVTMKSSLKLTLSASSTTESP